MVGTPPSPRQRARRQRKKPDWGNGGHGAHGARAGRAPASHVAQTGGQARERARAPAAAAPSRPTGWGAWLQIGFPAEFSSAFLLAFSPKKNSSALPAKRSAFRKILTKLSSTAVP